MLEYVKMILEKVSFDRYLFEKELRKATRSLLDSELSELQEWCYQRYEKEFGPELRRCFGTKAATYRSRAMSA